MGLCLAFSGYQAQIRRLWRADACYGLRVLLNLFVLCCYFKGRGDSTAQSCILKPPGVFAANCFRGKSRLEQENEGELLLAILYAYYSSRNVKFTPVKTETPLAMVVNALLLSECSPMPVRYYVRIRLKTEL